MDSPTGLEIAPGLPTAEPSRDGAPPQVGEELTKLHVLRECGALTEDEFIHAKGMVLDAQPAGRSAKDAYLDVRRRPNWLQRLARSGRDRVFGGVCGGLGERTPIPAWCWRLFFCAALVGYGAGFVTYLVLWMFVPAETIEAELPPETEPEA